MRQRRERLHEPFLRGRRGAQIRGEGVRRVASGGRANVFVYRERSQTIPAVVSATFPVVPLSPIPGMHFTRLSRVALLLPLCLPLFACGREDAGAKVARQMTAQQRRLNNRARAIGGIGAGSRAVSEQMDTAVHLPFARIAGYVVRGTDEFSFKACGSNRVHYVRLSPMAAAKVIQQYRFRSPQPLPPVYFTFKARIVDDTVRIGEHEYRSVVEVLEMTNGRDETPDCAKPGYGSFVASTAAARTTRSSGGDVP